MAEEIIIEIVSSGTKDAMDDFEDLNDLIEENTVIVEENADAYDDLSAAQDGVSNSTNKANKGFQGVEKSGAKAKKGLAGVSKGFKNVGTAIGASGIGLILIVFQALKTVLENQQPVLDLLDTAMTSISLGVSAVVGAVKQASENFDEAGGSFEAFKKVGMGVINLLLTPIQLEFQALKLQLLSAQLAWEESFFGDKDQQTIDELKANITETTAAITQLGVEALQSGKDIIENFSEAVNEVSAAGTAIIDEVKKIEVASIISEANKTTQLKNNAKLRTALNEKLLEEFDAQAEKQRQDRDNINLSFEARRKASEELGKTLEEQGKLMNANADFIVKAAEAELRANPGLIDAQVNLINAQKERAAVIATVIGLQTEQGEQERALNLEEIEGANAIIDKELEKALIFEESDAKKLELTIESTKLKLKNFEEAGAAETQQYRDTVASLEIAEAEKLKLVQDTTKETLMLLENGLKNELELEISAIEKGTIMRIEALTGSAEQITEAKMILKQQEIDAIKVVTDKAREEERKAEIALASEKIELASSVLSTLEGISTDLAEATNNRLDQESDRLQTQADEEIALTGEATQATLDAQLALEKERNKVLERQFKSEQAFGIASALIDGSRAIMKILAETPKADFGIATAIGIGLAAAATIGQVSAISSRKFKPEAPAGGTVPVPDVEVTPTSSTSTGTLANNTQFQQQELFGVGAEEVGAETNTPIKVAVLESDITQTQTKVKTIESSAEFGS